MTGVIDRHGSAVMCGSPFDADCPHCGGLAEAYPTFQCPGCMIDICKKCSKRKTPCRPGAKGTFRMNMTTMSER